jgi:RecB family exonuclease
LGLFERVAEQIEATASAERLSDRLDVAMAIRWAEGVVRDDAELLPGFVPAAHEMSFGSGDGARITLGGVGFRGIIDRVDLSNAALFVTDYKSSSVSGQEKFAKEGRIQAIVYALAAEEAFGLPVAGSVYRSLRRRTARGFWLYEPLGGSLGNGHQADEVDTERLGELIHEAGERVERAVAGIRAGRIPREPFDSANCRYCPLKLQCEGI